ncbi:Fic family protein [Rothia nasisuis]|uniref:Fic family protein n=1 Tax=Rothia nasisuis TaxID=2109647 RepID=UPI00235140AB|nr:Fic family protein [Rothia nasisuis]
MSSSWPKLTYAEHQWNHRDPLASRRSQLRNRGGFRAAVVPFIAERQVSVSPEISALVAEATARMTRFDQEFSQLSHFPFAAVLLRGESATSSQIENLTVNARKLSLASLGAEVGGNAELVARNVTAMKAAIDLAEHLDSAAILTMHRELTQGVQADAGTFRREWVWIGGRSPVTADYVGPTWEQVPALIDDLVAFAARQDLDPTLQAAIAHAQFETIHPFTDGNGRTGRALVSSILRARGVTRSVTVPISSGLLHDIGDYVEALTAYREGDVVPILECFVRSVDAALENARLLAADLEGVEAEILASRSRATEPVRLLARFVCAEPAFTASMLEQHAGVSKATAYRLVDALVETKILRVEKKVRGQKVWTCPGVLAALDAFAKRAGRREFSR